MSNIPLEHQWRYFFHFTDIRNLESILEHGLLCTNKKKELGIQHQDIANASIQVRRASMEVPCGCKGKVHDYVPFYFSSLNPMLLGVINSKNQDQPFIIYLCLKIQKIETLNAIFTDASANTDIPPTFYDDVADLNKINWDLVDSKKWSFSEEDRHKKMAEVLIYEKVDISDIDCIVVYNNGIKQNVQKILTKCQISIPIKFEDKLVTGVKYKFWYTKFFINGQKNDTLVTGPIMLKAEFNKCIDSIRENRDQIKSPYSFQNIEDAITHIKTNFCTFKELEGIYELATDNNIHPQTVSDHTQAVVENIKQTQYYKTANNHMQHILLFAAYLHDIGKGPKEKWTNNKIQKAYPDHPADSIPMMQRILTNDIQDIDSSDIRRLCLMVVYHDIIGDALFKGRNITEIVDIIQSEDELDALFCIAEADIKAINSNWHDKLIYKKKEFKNEILHLYKQQHNLSSSNHP